MNGHQALKKILQITTTLTLLQLINGVKAFTYSSSKRAAGRTRTWIVNNFIPLRFSSPPMISGKVNHSIGGVHRNHQALYSTSTTTTSTSVIISDVDRKFMDEALSRARMGLGSTFPNPAVGCLLVKEYRNSDAESEFEVVGTGFHPKAGLPHAEVFALMEAAGHVDDGVAAAMAVLPNSKKSDNNNNNKISYYKEKVSSLLEQYCSEGGAEALFAGCCDSKNSDNIKTTAYVTLEPCCHYGKTPPCAMSLVHAKVDRVVIGCRDTNPRVDGGGVKVLKENGVEVCFIDGEQAKQSRKVIDCFLKRITAPPLPELNGKKKRALRSIAGKLKSEGTIPEISLSVSSYNSSIIKIGENDEDYDVEDLVNTLTIAPGWLEEADLRLWQNELLLLRLGAIVNKKKAAKAVGQVIANSLGAIQIQAIGHTVLLYRPNHSDESSSRRSKIDLDSIIDS